MPLPPVAPVAPVPVGGPRLSQAPRAVQNSWHLLPQKGGATPVLREKSPVRRGPPGRGWSQRWVWPWPLWPPRLRSCGSTESRAPAATPHRPALGSTCVRAWHRAGCRSTPSCGPPCSEHPAGMTTNTLSDRLRDTAAPVATWTLSTPTTHLPGRTALCPPLAQFPLRDKAGAPSPLGGGRWPDTRTGGRRGPQALAPWQRGTGH